MWQFTARKTLTRGLPNQDGRLNVHVDHLSLRRSYENGTKGTKLHEPTRTKSREGYQQVGDLNKFLEDRAWGFHHSESWKNPYCYSRHFGCLPMALALLFLLIGFKLFLKFLHSTAKPGCQRRPTSSSIPGHRSRWVKGNYIHFIPLEGWFVSERV